MARGSSMFPAELFNDDGFNALPARAQRLFMWLWLHPDLNGAGVIAIQAREWASATGDLTAEHITEDAKTLRDEGWVDYDEGQLWLRPFMRLDGTLRSSTNYISAARGAKTIRSRRLRQAVWAQFRMYPRPVAPLPDPDNDKYGKKRRWAESMNESVDTAYAELERVISTPGVRESLAEIPHPIPRRIGAVDDEAEDEGEDEGDHPPAFAGIEQHRIPCGHCGRLPALRDGLCGACLGRGVKP